MKNPALSQGRSSAQHSHADVFSEVESVDEVIGQLRDQIGTLQLKDATHRQELAKLQ